MNICWLDYPTKTERTDNIGRDVISEVLTIAGYRIDISSSTQGYDVVLVSLPSTYQIVDYLCYAVDNNLDKRTCKIIVGGFGCQNIGIISRYVDYAYYGRAHQDIASIIDDIAAGRECRNNHLYDVGRGNMVTVNHDAALYTGSCLTEEFAGCCNRCSFCHYAHVRKRQTKSGSQSSYIQGMLTNGASTEMLLLDIHKMQHGAGRIRTAIDGCSERLRMKYGKKIKNTDIQRAVYHVSTLKESNDQYQYNIFGGVDYVGKKACTVLMIYNIGNMPTESNSDVEELHDTFRMCRTKERVICIIHTTPFRPSLLTPMQWEPVSIYPDWSKKREHIIIDSSKLLAKYSFTLEGTYSHLSSVVVDRYGIFGEDNDISDCITKMHKSSLSSKDKTEILLSSGAMKYTNRLDIDNVDMLPHVTSYYSKRQLRAIAKRLR